jgi:hypothetical protein
MKENVQMVSSDSAAAVEDLYGLVVVVAGHNHFSAEGESFVGGNEGITGPDFVTTGRYTICIFAAAFFARTICGYTHPNGLPLGSDLRRSFHFRLIKKDYRRQNNSGENIRA